jgi:hypothetical protein
MLYWFRICEVVARMISHGYDFLDSEVKHTIVFANSSSGSDQDKIKQAGRHKL